MAAPTAPRRVRKIALTDHQRQEIGACGINVEHWIADYITIEDPQADATAIIPFTLWPCQQKLVWMLARCRQVLILKARQLGISWLVCAYVLHLVLYNDGRVILLFSKGQGEANELARRILGMYRRLPDWMRSNMPQLDRETTTALGWDNGSRIESLPATQTAGRSFTASAVIMDEAAFMLWGSELYTAVKPTIDGGGQIIVLSTANGIGNLFHKLWMRSQEKIGRFKSVFIPWWERPGRDRDWYRAVLGDFDDPEKMKQEYPSSPEEAFIVSGRVRFYTPWVDIQQDSHREPIPPESVAMLAPDLPLALHKHPGLNVWALPKGRTPIGPRYVIGVDVAEGVAPGDWHHAVVLDRHSWEEQACLHRDCEADQFGEEVADLAEWYDAQVAVERNNHGHVVISVLKRRCATRIMKGHDKKWGWLTNVQTKPQIIDRLAAALRDNLLTIRDRNAAAEMRIYQIRNNGETSAPEGYFDDRVMSWAIAIEMSTHPMTTSQAVAGGERALVQSYVPR